MSFELKIALQPQATELLSTLATAGPRALQAMAKALDLQNELTIGYAQKNKMSGPRPGVLGVRTGRLRQGLSRVDASVDGDLVDGGIGENVKYAGVHEFGFDGDVQVKPFVRRTRSRDLRNQKKKLIASGVSFVKAFTRHMHVPERSFVRSSISERIGSYNVALSQAILDELGGAQ